jgi:hypothetical protein
VRRLRVTASSAGHSGGFGTRPGGITTPARGARCDGLAPMPVRKRGPEPKNAASGAPRGERAVTQRAHALTGVDGRRLAVLRPLAFHQDRTGNGPRAGAPRRRRTHAQRK